MKIKTRRRKIIDIADSGSLSDLAFLLIVFFIVIAVFNVNQGFILSLPQKGSSKVVNINDIIRVTLTANNELTFENNSITIPQLEIIIKERLNVMPNMTFLLKIDPAADFQHVVNVVDIVRKLEINNFSFSMLKD